MTWIVRGGPAGERTDEAAILPLGHRSAQPLGGHAVLAASHAREITSSLAEMVIVADASLNVSIDRPSGRLSELFDEGQGGVCDFAPALSMV
jgi:hypothetical protein